MTVTSSQPPSPKAKTTLSIVFLGLSALLLFTSLDTYAFWDDEASTALYALSVSRTGDTGAVFDYNVLAYRNGLELSPDLKNRITSPLMYYFSALTIRLFGTSTLAMRAPYALVTLCSLGLIVLWLWRSRVQTDLWVLIMLGFLGNVSLFLHGRQCRYYALSTFLTLALVMLYARRTRDNWFGVSAIATVGALLMSTNYLQYAAVGAALGVDYLIWGRTRRPMALRHIAFIAASQVIATSLVMRVWSPIGKNLSGYVPPDRFLDRVSVLWVNFRDLNTAEFGVGVLLLLGPAYALWHRRCADPIVRVVLGIACAIVATSVFSPQPGNAPTADVRYLSHLIPFAVIAGVLSLRALLPAGRLRDIAALLCFFTTFAQAPLGKMLGAPPMPVRSTPLAFVRELLEPQRSPYGEAVKWLQANVQPGASVWVLPDFATYPLMWYAPELQYAWQLTLSRRDDFPTLDDIHFRGVVRPDWVVAFGPHVRLVRDLLAEPFFAGYREVARLPVYGRDLTRPEIPWRTFATVTAFDLEQEGIYFFAKPQP